MGAAELAIAASLQAAKAALPNLRAWHIENTETGEELEAQHEPVNLTRNVSTAWAESYALNRDLGIMQFLHGQLDTYSFQARFLNHNEFSAVAQEALEKLIEWTRRDDSVGRPPICLFWVGNGDIEVQCVIESIADIVYDRPTVLGAIRGVTFTVNLREFYTYDPEGGEPPETRYHRARRRDYYELLCAREYGNPMLGEIIRRRHPDQHLIEPGDIVKLPSADAVRRSVIEPASPALAGAFSKKDNPQRANLRSLLAERNGLTYYSHVIKTSI